MTLSEELSWRGFVGQTTYQDIKALDNSGIKFYWGVDPSADSMTIGHLAIAMLVKHLVSGGHEAVLLVGGATGLIGDPDGKKTERELKSLEDIDHNKQALVAQYHQLFDGQEFEIVDNYDWFKDMNCLTFLRDVGKHVPMRQMLGREFVAARLKEEGDGISYAEFSYSLIQGYDFWHLFQEGVKLQIAGSDQWGNSIAGVDLIRRLGSGTADVLTAPLVINPLTGQKFGKTEAGAIWLDAQKTSVTSFYQFWVTLPDQDTENYLKIYTLLDKPTIDQLMSDHQADPKKRLAQKRLAAEVTALVHGKANSEVASRVTSYLINEIDISQANDSELDSIRKEIPSLKVASGCSTTEALVGSGLAKSNTEARELLGSQAVYVNGQAISSDRIEPEQFQNGRLLIRRGKAFKDSALLEL